MRRNSFTTAAAAKAAAAFTLAALLASCQLASVPTTPANRYALVIGIASYQTVTPTLQYPDDDANDMTALLTAKGWTVKNTLINSDATYKNIKADIADLSDDKDATILLYYSGHGTLLDDTAYILPYDTTATYTNGWLSSLTNVISPATITNWMAAVPAKNRLLILDSCYSGAFATSDAAVDTSPADYSQSGNTTSDTSLIAAALSKLNTLLAANISNYGSSEIQVLSAAGSDEYSYDGTTSMANGAFTYYLLQAGDTSSSTGLAKGDADGDGTVTVDEAYVYAKAQIKAKWDALYARYDEDFLPHISGGTRDVVLYAGS
jgi:uncharacterized caspase-like protein